MGSRAILSAMTKKAKAKRGPERVKPADPFFRPFEKLASKKRPAKSAAPPPPPKPAPVVTEQSLSDQETFARYMAGVRTLEPTSARIPKTASRIERAAPSTEAPPDLDAPAREQMRALVSEGLRFELSDDGQHLEGRRVDLDPRELRKLRKGAYHVDGKLDLHGHPAASAREAVETFVRKRRAEGDRVLLVVHGKGNHSPRGIPVLRGEIAAWLSQGRVARHVAAFTSVSDGDGASGAVLVLLAR